MLLGDSIIYGGTQVNNEETIGGQLSRLQPEIEALNAAAGGWSVHNELLWLRNRGPFGSQEIILEIGENDLFQGFVPASIVDNNPSFPSKAPRLAACEVLFRYLLPWFGLGSSAQDPGTTAVRTNIDRAEAVLAAVENVRAVALSRGIEFRILYIDPKEPAEDRDTITAVSHLLRWAEAHDVMIIRPSLHLRTGRSVLYRDNVHPSALGNLEIAKAIAAALQSQ